MMEGVTYEEYDNKTVVDMIETPSPQSALTASRTKSQITVSDSGSQILLNFAILYFWKEYGAVLHQYHCKYNGEIVQIFSWNIILFLTILTVAGFAHFDGFRLSYS